MNPDQKSGKIIQSEREDRGFKKAPDNIKSDVIEDDINLLKKAIPEKDIETIWM